MKVIVAGGGRTGSQLARTLLNEDHRVNLVECNKRLLNHLHRELPTEVIVEGNYVDYNVLEQAGAKDADVLAAVTSKDDQNLALCYIARKCYNIPRTIARVNNPRTAWLFTESFCVDVVVNHSEIMSHLIVEEMSMGDMMTLLKLRRGDYSLVEEKVEAGAPAVGVAIRDMGLPEKCALAAVIRHKELIVPRGSTVLEVDDEVLAVTDHDGAHQLSKILSPSH